MSTIPHRIHRDLYRGPKQIHDPGDGGTIQVNADLQVCELTTGASNETRTISNPSKPGIRFHLRLLTDGGGNAVVTASNGFNAALDTVATLDDAGDYLELVSVTLNPSADPPTCRWETLVQSGSAVSSTSPSTSVSSSPSSSVSSSPSATPSSSPSAT